MEEGRSVRGWWRAGAARAVGVLTAGMLLLLAGPVWAKSAPRRDAAAEILAADRALNQAVADKAPERFRALVAEGAVFAGGPMELHGRDAVMEGWASFFSPDGPALSWTPRRALMAAPDLGMTAGTFVLRSADKNGVVTEQRGAYATTWRKQADGAWQVVYDTGSTATAARTARAPGRAGPQSRRRAPRAR